MYKISLGPIQNPESDETNLIFSQTQKEFKMIPNMYRVMANAPELLQTYIFGYKKFRENSDFTPAEQEVIFLVISYENGCDYCMAAHSTAADFQSNVPRSVTESIRNDTEISDVKMKALAQFTKEVLLSRGRPSAESTKEFISAGFSEKQILDIVLAIATKTISNYTNHLFDTPVDKIFRAREFKTIQFVNRVFQSFKK